MARMGCNRLVLPAEDEDDDAAKEEEEEGVLMGDPSLLRLTRAECTGDADMTEPKYVVVSLQNTRINSSLCIH